jgi:hypothetical protein
VPAPRLEGALGDPRGQPVEHGQLGVDVEVGLGVGGDQEGRLVQRQLVLRALDELREASRRVHAPSS